MSQVLQILLVEDAPLDAELTLGTLNEGGVHFEAVRVETRDHFRRELARPQISVILSDFSLPAFEGTEALLIAREMRPEVPFIFVSGALGEERAVDMLKQGATDYVLKQRLERLAPAVKRAVAEAREREERRRIEETLHVERRRAEAEREALLAGERAARSEAERASRMKDEFLATLGHELRTPLNAIVGWAQILRNKSCTPEDLAEGLAVIERNATAQARIIEDLLDMSRITSGKVRLDIHPVDLNEVITSAVETARPASEGKGVQLQRVLGPHNLSTVRGDPGRLQQVVWNLLTNAIKFTPKGGRVQIRVDQVQSHLEITVSDTGAGIKPEFLPYVFDRFRQADASTTRHHGGLGLGLAIVKHLVELHGGTVRAESEGLGKGATFIVSLPLPAVRADQSPNSDGGPVPVRRNHPQARPERTDLTNVTILMVDDEPDARRLVTRILEDCNARVLTAGSVDEALSVFGEQPVDVLVSDIGMPRRDGYDLIRTLRARPANRGGVIPAVALTAFARTEDRRAALTAGFDMHLPKPVDPTELCEVVARLAGRTRSPA